MRGRLRALAATAVTTLALIAPAGPALAAPTAPTHRSGTEITFTLVTPNTAVAPTAGMMAAPGDRIVVTGGGRFDPRTGTVRAGGRFLHVAADGTVHGQGTWTATELVGWTDFGAARDHRHGGVVSLLITHDCATTGMVHTGIPMTVTSALDAPAGTVTGVTVGDFTVPSGGKVRITVHRETDPTS